MAASLASAPELQKNMFSMPVMPGVARRPTLAVDAKEVRGVNKLLRLFDYRGRDLRMLMPQIRDGDPRDAVQIGPVVGVIQTAPSPREKVTGNRP